MIDDSMSAPEMINTIRSAILLDKKKPTPEEYGILLDAIRAHRVTLGAPPKKTTAAKVKKSSSLSALLEEDIGGE